MNIDSEVSNRFPDFKVLIFLINDVTVKPESHNLEAFKPQFISQIRSKYDLETLKDIPELRVYRNFFWKIGIDPTKTRPASEALIRRVIQGKPLPRINTLVDSYNLASMESRIALAAFDNNIILNDLLLRFAEGGELFTGTGMKKPVILKGNELVIQSGDELIALYPHRDADKSKITLSTKNVLMMVCGVPEISSNILKKAKKTAVTYVTRFCKGQ